MRLLILIVLAAGTLGFVTTREKMQTHDALTYADGYLRGEWRRDNQ